MRHSLLASTLLTAVTVASGCGLTCKKVRSQLEEAKQTELADSAAEKAESDPDPHFAVGLRTETLESIAADVAGSAIRTVLSAARKLDVDGNQPVSVEALPEIQSFSLDRREEACPHCFRVSAELEGSANVDIPVLGHRAVPLSGTIQFVAPITVGPGDDSGTTAIELDLGEAARQNAPIVALELTNLRKSWRQTLQSLLSSALADALLENLEPVVLATFEPPDLGLPGLGLQPTGLRITPDGTVVQALVSTDIPMPDPPTAEALGEAARPSEDHNLAIGLPTGLVPAGVAHGFRSGDVSRTYTEQGEAAEQGPFQVTVREFTVGSDAPGADGKSAEDRRDYGFEFRTWRLEDGGPCYWLDGRATGTIQAADSTVAVSVDDVTFTDSSASGLTVTAANWMSAQFIKTGARIVGASLDGENLSLPGGVYGIGNVDLGITEGFLTLSGVANKQQEIEQDGGE